MNRRDTLKTLGLSAAGCILGAEAGGGSSRGAAPAAGARPQGALPAAGNAAAERAAHDLFERYERRFAEARLRMPDRDPARPAEREAIARAARECLGIRDAWMPTVTAVKAGESAFDGGRIEKLRARSWPGVTGAALLYIPERAPAGPRPLVLLCCGHGAGGKLSAGYQRMARHVTRRGAMVLCPDNIGQGERGPMGHGDCVKPFACGTSVQGLIVMETLAWIAWALQDPRVDPRRVAAIGNSGGGTLTVFLAALCPELAALSSSGYPSTFEFVARKEKKHCHCNILPGVIGRIEMWHLLAAFAPRPLFLFQGSGDPLFPPDLFHHVARKVRRVYRERAAPDFVFQARVMPGDHPWDAPRALALGDFLARHLRLGNARPGSAPDESEVLLGDGDGCLGAWPTDALTTDQLAERLSGRRVPDSARLWDVYPPALAGGVPPADVTGRGATLQILAQFEAFLGAPAAAT